MIAGLSTSGNDRKECEAVLSFPKGRVISDCSSCQGPFDLGNRRCFIGIASRMPPGFRGEIVLRGFEDRGYRGEIVETLCEFSDILSMIGSLREEYARGPTRLGLSREISGFEEAFLKDPCKVAKDRGRYLRGIKKRSRDTDLAKSMEEILERSSLMVRRLKAFGV